MKNLLQIYGKYIAVSWGIILLLLLGNIGIIFYIAEVQVMQEIVAPAGLGALETRLFKTQDKAGVLEMQADGEALLNESEFIFLFVLDDAGDVIYKWRYPDILPDHYTAGEIAAFSRWYLQGYPVKVWRSDYGLLVAGREKDSVWKYPVEFPMTFMDSLGQYLQIIFWVNLAIVLFLIGYLGYRFYRSLQPLSEGLSMLSQNRKVHLSEKGTLSKLASQMNKTSDILENQRIFLEQRDSARTEWIAGVSHDIRTPLTVIMGYADQLENDMVLNERERECVEAIRLQSMNIRKLIEDLNLTSKLEYHMQPLRVKEFYPAALLRSLVAEALNEGYGERYEINLSFMDEFSGTRIQGDEDLIARAVRNLIHNSIRHNPQGCEIMIEGDLSGQEMQIAVSDTGKGIPDSVIAALEDRERQAAYNEQKPHIMGLRIAKQIALAHNGSFIIAKDGHRVSLAFPCGWTS